MTSADRGGGGDAGGEKVVFTAAAPTFKFFWGHVTGHSQKDYMEKDELCRPRILRTLCFPLIAYMHAAVSLLFHDMGASLRVLWSRLIHSGINFQKK